MISTPARFIASRLSRRFTALFALAALAPLIVIAGLTLTYVRTTLVDQGQQRIARYAKGYGMEVFARLLEAAEFAAVAGMSGIAPPTQGGTTPALFSTVLPFSAIEAVPAGSESILRNRMFADLPLRAAQRARLARGQRVVIVRPNDAHAANVVMVVPGGPPHSRYWIYAELSPAHLWGSSDTWPGGTTFCIVAAESLSPVYCREALPAAVLHASPNERVDAGWRSVAWERDGERLQSAVWPQFLDAEFGASDWLVIATQAEAEMLRPAVAFKHVFVPVLLLTLLIVAWASMRLIRTTLSPLAQLTRATRLIAEKRFDLRLDASRTDEFGILAGAFNSMSARLGRQFQSLCALAEIDREILASRDLDRVSIAALHHVQQLVSARTVGVMLFERPGETNARIWFARGDRATAIAATQTSVTRDDVALLRGNGDSGDLHGVTAIPECLTAIGLPSGQPVLICPIVWRESLCGCLVLALDSPDALPNDDKAQLREAAARLAVAISSAWRDTQLYHQAHHDALTGLPNRPLFFERVAREIARCDRDGTQFALLFLDLDHFKKVNDSQGHFRGDLVLCETARRLVACIRATDTVARFGGDEFAITVACESSRRELGRVVQRVLDSLAEPFGQDGTRSHLGASLGIAIYPTDGHTAEELLQNADTAMYQAKAGGRGQAVYFHEAMNREARERVTLEEELHTAIACEEFFLTYQPQIEILEERIVGAEALIRWKHPARGLVSPAAFIPMAEESSLIEAIGTWVIRQACAHVSRLQRMGVALERVAVNVSVRQLHDPQFVDIVADALARSGCAPTALELEITESVLADRRSAVQEVLNRVAALGVVLALDDFGTGYASLAYLRDLPVAIVKIDRSFIRGLPSDEESIAIVRATIAMAHALKKKVVAEGVETHAQMAMLRELGCDIAQGYLIAKPLAVPQLESFLGVRSRTDPATQHAERVAA